MHSSKELLTTSIFYRQGVNDFRSATTLGTFTNTTIQYIMVHTFHNYSLLWVAFEYNSVSNYILCTCTDRLSKSLFWPPKTRVRGCFFPTLGVGRIHQAYSEFEASLDIFVLCGAIFLQCLPKGTSIALGCNYGNVCMKEMK